MKLIKPLFEIWEQETPELSENISIEKRKDILMNAVYKQIEKAGRTCYKSEDKITEASAYPFVKQLIDSDHLAMLEHGTIYLFFPEQDLVVAHEDSYREINNLCRNKYTEFNEVYSNSDNFEPGLYITTNLRVLIENHIEWMTNAICTPTKVHKKRITVHFVCNRQVSHEFVRHRVFSFAQESTRYCNYTKGKFGSELTFIQPCWSEVKTPEEYYDMSNTDADMYIALNQIEQSYFKLIEHGWKPQQAATILPNAIKTELVMTGFIDDWNHFFDLRALGKTGAPHPQAKELAFPLYEEFKNKKYLDETSVLS